MGESELNAAGACSERDGHVATLHKMETQMENEMDTANI